MCIRDRIDQFLRELQSQGLENILALRGDRNHNIAQKEDFFHASELTTYIKKNGNFCVAGACYPEGHPESPDMVSDITNIKKKVEAGDAFLISQLFFENEMFYNYVEKLRIAGVNVPVTAGIMPVINKAQIEKMVSVCGASLPEKFKRILTKFENNKEALYDAGIAYAVNQVVDLLASDVDGIHLYTMNNPRVARKICESIRNII